MYCGLLIRVAKHSFSYSCNQRLSGKVIHWCQRWACVLWFFRKYLIYGTEHEMYKLVTSLITQTNSFWAYDLQYSPLPNYHVSTSLHFIVDFQERFRPNT